MTAKGTALESTTAAALAAIGFAVEPGEPGRTDLVVRLGRRTAVVEVKGKTKGAAERDVAQAAKWVHSYFADHQTRAKGVLVVNGWMSKPLSARPPVFAGQLLKYATEQSLCLISGEQLLRLWIDAIERPASVPAAARAILRTVGVFDGPGLGGLT